MDEMDSASVEKVAKMMPKSVIPAMYKVGDKIRFAEEKKPYTIQARDERYLICTKPFNLKHTVLYTIVDLFEGIRGADNYYRWGGRFAYDTMQGCKEALYALYSFKYDLDSDGIEISRRNRVKLNIV